MANSQTGSMTRKQHKQNENNYTNYIEAVQKKVYWQIKKLTLNFSPQIAYNYFLNVSVLLKHFFYSISMWRLCIKQYLKIGISRRYSIAVKLQNWETLLSIKYYINIAYTNTIC